MSLANRPMNCDTKAAVLIIAGGIFVTVIWILGWWKLVELLREWFA